MHKKNIWFNQLQKLRALSQNGLTYSNNEYDIYRYEQIKQIVHEMYSEVTDLPLEKIDTFFLPDRGYATPKVDLRAGIFKDGKILMVKERSNGLWSLPGGWADVLESPKAGIIREVKEESGYDICSPQLVAIVDRSLHDYIPIYPHHIYKFFFVSRIVSGEPTINIEIEDIHFFSEHKSPPLCNARVLKKDITRLFYAYHNINNVEVYID